MSPGRNAVRQLGRRPELCGRDHGGAGAFNLCVHRTRLGRVLHDAALSAELSHAHFPERGFQPATARDGRGPFVFPGASGGGARMATGSPRPGRDRENVTEKELAGNEPIQPLLLLMMPARTESWPRASANLYSKTFFHMSQSVRFRPTRHRRVPATPPNSAHARSARPTPFLP